MLFLVGLIFVPRFFIWSSIYNTNWRTAQSNFSLSTDRATTALQSQFEIYGDQLYSARALLLVDKQVSGADWQNFIAAQKLTDRYPAISGIAYATVIQSGEEANFTAQLNASQSSPVTIFPHSTVPTSAVITFVAPQPSLTKAIGYNLLTDPIRTQTLALARDTGQPALSPPLTLLAETPTNQSSILIALPVYTTSVPLQTISERQQALSGYILLALHVQPLFQSVFSSPTSSAMTVLITSGGNVMYQRGLPLKGAVLQRTVTLTIGGQAWHLIFSAPQSYGLSLTARLAPLLLTVSLIPLIIILAIALFVARYTRTSRKN